MCFKKTFLRIEWSCLCWSNVSIKHFYFNLSWITSSFSLVTSCFPLYSSIYLSLKISSIFSKKNGLYFLYSFLRNIVATPVISLSRPINSFVKSFLKTKSVKASISVHIYVVREPTCLYECRFTNLFQYISYIRMSFARTVWLLLLIGLQEDKK